ncbi:hypothetical protein GE09DRAFT_637143 [Coniochaeta sp. 2T2.1]|nr:hypothetical protein GE09DRAFT_637143 [Coniochaeta sp. 2T2.1]
MKFQLLLPILISLAQANPPCPTITTHSLCPTCPVNACLSLSTVTIPCNCPPSTAIPTTTISHPCSDTCWAPECAGTSYAFTTEQPCPTTTPPPVPSCPTITTSVRPADCTPPPPPGASFCAELPCLQLESVTWPCSCVGQEVKTETKEVCECRSGCETSTGVVYLPCPTDGPGCPA